MARELASPKPEMLKWARTASGYDPDRAAKKLNIARDRLLAWEAGIEYPTFRQLHNLARTYKRPTAIFYRTEVPPAPVSPTDFRSISSVDTRPNELSTELLYEIRRARDRRLWTIEMWQELGRALPSIDLVIHLDEDHERAAMRVRETLAIDVRKQTTWRGDYEALNAWRSCIEGIGILCFQARRVAVKECRGFSITENPMPVVVVNSKDAVRGRIFTLLHELVHVFLRTGGLCILGDDQKVESYCNQVAGAVIFPRSEFMSTEVVRLHPGREMTWSDTELSSLSNRFGGSREAALVRLVELKLTTVEFYRAKRAELIKTYPKNTDDDSFVPHHVLELASAGAMFTSTVLESLERNNITLSDASEFLQIGFRHLTEAEKTAAKYEGRSAR
jgi:Zn-dependent peptidase ImmA (M78 family)